VNSRNLITRREGGDRQRALEREKSSPPTLNWGGVAPKGGGSWGFSNYNLVRGDADPDLKVKLGTTKRGEKSRGRFGKGLKEGSRP